MPLAPLALIEQGAGAQHRAVAGGALDDLQPASLPVRGRHRLGGDGIARREQGEDGGAENQTAGFHRRAPSFSRAGYAFFSATSSFQPCWTVAEFSRQRATSAVQPV